ncbi:unnamed protein product [Brachionus calyciflorus]|uniref:Uncharacterized protein n=1 Tax=Brachionus calyciflorus TaxID=104777 RepID=A0A814CGP4_9BILA|nr:unnamed protein product [Brachionus calyciflorus]
MFEDDFRKKIRSDIFNIQTLSSDILFNDAVKLFVLKYKRFKNAALNDFLSYFENEWVKKNSGWYEGYAIGMPSTTNGLESSHEKIKKSLQHKRLGLIEFLNECKNNLINFWSQDRSASLFIRDPDTEEFIENKRDKRIVHNHGSYFIKSGDEKDKPTKETIKEHLVKIEKQEWSSFVEMINIVYDFYKVEINLENWKLMDFSSIGMNLPIHNNKKREVSSKTVECLKVQPSDLAKDLEEKSIFDDDFSTQEPISKRQKTTENSNKLCETCGEPLQKKLVDQTKNSKKRIPLAELLAQNDEEDQEEVNFNYIKSTLNYEQLTNMH